MITNIAVNFRQPEGCDVELLKRYARMRGVVEVDDVPALVAYPSDARAATTGACVSIAPHLTA